MKKPCHACGENIPESAKICSHCDARQLKFVYYFLALFGPRVISTLALAVSGAALYFSRVAEPPNPNLFVQVDLFDETSFSFFVANLGELPTVVRHFDLIVRLHQAESLHSLRAGFSVSPTEIAQGESQFFKIAYADFVPGEVHWTTFNAGEPFTLSFLNAAAALGNNLHCEVEVYFPSRRYFPSNIVSSASSVNGTCAEAMQWFALNIGPLKEDQNPD